MRRVHKVGNAGMEALLFFDIFLGILFLFLSCCLAIEEVIEIPFHALQL